MLDCGNCDAGVCTFCPGIHSFCSDCEREGNCVKRNLPKILDCNQTVIKFMYQIEGGFKMYPNEGSWIDQPEWFNYLLGQAQAEFNRIQRAKIKDK